MQNAKGRTDTYQSVLRHLTGGFEIAAESAGFTTILHCEIDPYCQSVLRHHWPDVPIISDVREVTLERVKHSPTLLTASPPCQPVSCAGKRRGKADDRWLWGETIRVLAELRPRWACFENPAGIINMGLDGVLSDMASAGYSCQTVIIPACAVNAPHRRDRVWIVACDTKHNGLSAAEIGGRPVERNELAGREGGQVETREPEGPSWVATHATSTRESVSETRRTICDEFGRGFRDGAVTGCPDVADTISERGCGGNATGQDATYVGERPCDTGDRSRNSEPVFCSVDDGLSRRLAGQYPTWAGGEWEAPPPLAVKPEGRVNRLKALGNAVVWQTVYPILEALAQYERGRE